MKTVEVSDPLVLWLEIIVDHGIEVMADRESG